MASQVKYNYNSIGNPYLYDLKFQLMKNHRILDEKIINYGIRTIKVDPD